MPHVPARLLRGARSRVTALGRLLGDQFLLHGGCGDGNGDLLIGLEKGLILVKDVPDGGLGPDGQTVRPDLRGRAADVVIRVDPVQAGQGLIHPP